MRKRITTLALIFILLIAGLTACAFKDSQQNSEIKALDIQVVQGKEASFNFSIDKYVEQYNSYYKADFGEDYLTLSDDDRSYFFSEDENIITLPTLAMSATDNGKYVKKIILSFDWHSFSDALREKFDSMCFYAVKTALPEMSDEEITELCSKAVKEGYDNAKENGDSVPYALYHSGNIGITTHFAIGESQHLCIIPVNSKIIKEYKDKGVKIIDIDQ